MVYKKIAIIGNGGGGKTTLSRKISSELKLPLHHVDSIQFLPGLKRRNVEETNKILKELANQDRWLIDGFGSLEVIKERFLLSDLVILVDFPLWRHYFWASKRQIQSYWKTREELPEGCDEKGLKRTLELFKILWRVHQNIIPDLKSYLKENKVNSVRISNLKEWNDVHQLRF